jgi:hypothetical protein
MGVLAERDKPLSFHWRAESDEYLNNIPPPGYLSESQRRAWASIILDAVLEEMGVGRWISYSRRKSFYSGCQRYYGTDYTYCIVPPIVDHLEAAGIIEHEKARPGDLGWQSRFRAAPGLVEAVTLPPVTHDPLELVRLKKDKRLVDYRDTAGTETWRRKLQGFNEVISGSVITLDVGEHDGNVIRCGNHTLYPAMEALYRVFNDDWKHGGRLYGGWWQQARKKDREQFRIDGVQTVEPDYEQLHPTLIYGMAGKQRPEDAYVLDGWERDTGKRAFNILINATNYHKAVGAVANEIGGTGAWAKAVQLIHAMKERHQPIETFFHSDAGRELQNIDAGMAEHVMDKMTGRSIVALPIHDSFIVPQQHENTLRETMDEALEMAIKNAV